ncbi:carbon-nitrogen hydrolase family protein [Spirosoma sp. HMF4905]|uniref:Carbon-nitrogen hydrolase family protein n=1 Tax=Spirosoma arboris TaxID=2682092 RepID=A0A7K1SF86_9BACT|nr:nitrilase-related carbon-nitrogen hydrolase [Spirosoma arboris]MVM32403.1 carbon-nitrogen hydrolase family protein [Spirosoma arboris]
MPINIRKYTIILLVGILLSWGVFGLWSIWLNGELIKPDISAKVSQVEQFGTRSGHGNLLGIQPWMEPADYQNGLTFREKIAGYLQTAKDSGLIIPQKTIVILPEYLGTWLVVMNESNRVHTAHTIQDGLTAMVVNHPINFWKAYRTVPESVSDKTKYAVFAMKARQMAYEYQLAFDMLAAQFEVTIVAGSILLPNPSVKNGKLVVGDGLLYNVSTVFRPDGKLEPQLIKKVYPIADELPFVCPTNPADVPVFNTPIGRLGVLVCADSWNSPVYQTLKQKGATLLAVPSYSAGDHVWKTIWRGYSGTPTPDDARDDVGKLTEGQAWLAHAMAGRAAPEANITQGMNVFLRGKLWDLGSDGTTIMLTGKATPQTARYINGAAIICLWL